MSAPLATLETGSGPAVLLVHGWTGFKESWGGLPGALAAAGRRAVAVDLPGWGGSPAPRRFPHTPEAYAAALRPLVERLAPVALVGHSMGVQPAVLLGAHPGVRSLVAISPAAVPAGARLPPDRVSDAIGIPLLGPPAAAVVMTLLRLGPARWWEEALMASVADPERMAADPDIVALAGLSRAALRATPTRTLVTSLARAADCDLRPAAGRVRVPALVVSGERDRSVHPGEAVSLAGALPGGRLLRISGAAHLPQLERPELVIPAIVEHLAGR